VTRKSRLILLAVAIATLAGLFAVASAATQFLFSAPDTVYAGEPITFSVQAYDPALATTYGVDCNLTVTNATRVVHTATFTGDPATYTFTYWRPEQIQYTLSCQAEDGTTQRFQGTITVEPPTFEVTPNPAPWNRSITLTISASYPYNADVNLTVPGAGTTTITFTNGTASAGPYTFTEPTAITIQIYDLVVTVPIDIAPPRLVIGVEPAEPVAGAVFTITPYLVDDYGYAPYWGTINLTAGGCQLSQTTVQPLTPVTAYAQEPGYCTITAWANLGYTVVTADTLIPILPPEVLALNFTIEPTVSQWQLRATLYAVLESPINYTAVIYVDGTVLVEEAGAGDQILLVADANLPPGEHVFVAVIVSPELGGNITLNRTIELPKYDYEICLDDEYYIPAGADINDYITLAPGEYAYIWWDEPGAGTILVYYPGNQHYNPATDTARIILIEPTVLYDNGAITLYNVNPGAHITIYCDDLILAEYDIYATTTTNKIIDQITLQLPDATCPALTIEYRAGTYTAIWRISTIDTVIHALTLTLTTTANTPFAPVESNPLIKTAYIDGHPYTPGDKITLEPGPHSLTIILIDGTILEYTIHVQPTIITLLYYENTKRLVAIGPPAQIKVTFEDGTTLTITAPATLDLVPAPADAWSPAGEVKIIKIKE